MRQSLSLVGRRRLLVNFAAFQAGWFAAVLGGAWGWVWTGCAIAALIVTAHVITAAKPRRELALLVSVLVLGTAWDSALAAARVIEYPHGVLIAGAAPIWIVAVWALFATTLNLSLGYLKGRYWLASLFGAVGAPLSFSAGMKLQALYFPGYTRAIWVLAIGWAVLMPALVWLAKRFNGVDGEVTRS